MRRLSFSAEMVRARNEGRKTMTRRLLKPQPVLVGQTWEWPRASHFDHLEGKHCLSCASWADGIDPTPCMARFCHYGDPGELLAETEEWAVPARYDDFSPAKLRGELFPAAWLPHFFWRCGDGPKPQWAGRTRLARHMPAALARRALPLVSVRVERLHEIAEADAQREGVASVAEFSDLWEGIHGAFSWGHNPWVWVLTLSPVTEVEA